MSELAKYFWCCPEWVGSLSRLNSGLFSMLVASAFGSALRNPGKLICLTTSSLFRPNQ
jgi:hypothetical protein